jgi:hypothetical protein
MPIDLTALSPKAREGYIRLGRRFSSPFTLAQANQTLKGLADHGSEVAKHGFVAEDTQRLTDARDGLLDAGVGRIEARGDKNVTSKTYLAAVETGRSTRLSARTVLENTRRVLHEKRDLTAEAAVTRVDTALQQTRTASRDAVKLAEQLDVLRDTLADPALAPEAQGRGGPQAVVDLQTAAATLRAAAVVRTGARGTPAETERLDLLDGIVVTFTRNARKAARAAAKRLGTPALAADFELTKLYAPRAEPAPAAPANENGNPTPCARIR